MASTNDITGDSISSKINTEAYRNNWDAIFGKKGQRSGVDSKGFASEDQQSMGEGTRAANVQSGQTPTVGMKR